MTTTVITEAHCDSKTTEVKISITGLADIIIQDGESHSASVYDDVTVNVAEVAKLEATTKHGHHGPGCNKDPNC